MTAADAPPGRPGNLTPEQEEKLRELWMLVLRICRSDEPETASLLNGSGADTTSEHSSAPAAQGAGDAKKKRSFFGKKAGNGSSKSDSPGVLDDASFREGAADDKYGQTKQFLDTLASQTPKSIRDTIWSMVKHDHPDALLLRFLRARKWDVNKALVMLISTMNWRATEMHVDDDIIKNGEAGALEAEKTGDEAAKRLGHGFMAQLRMGKSFLHGADKEGRPVCFVRVRLHRQGEYSEESLERSTVYLIETARYMLKPPVDTATIVFDMTGFSMANMDYTPVKFMVKCFEANYPESLGAVLIYKAPWIFQGIWRIIKGWLDPVVASKVHFLSTPKEMANFIDLDGLPKETDGNEDWEYKYVEPVEGENSCMADAAARDALLKTRWELVDQYEQATLQWASKAEDAGDQKAVREALATKLRENYWDLDPYLRARCLYDRLGMIKPGGGLEFYPERRTAAESNDDVD